MYELLKDVVSFPTFEKREQAFIDAVCGLVPRRYAGPSLFFKDFMSIASSLTTKERKLSCAFITTNPQDCLAFGTASQVIRASYLAGCTTCPGYNFDLDRVYRMFRLTHHCDQPIRTLSGGETVQVALAKAYVASEYANQLIVASPFSWLAPQNADLLQNVVRTYQDKRKEVRILALDGEDYDQPVNPHHSDGLSRLSFKLDFTGVAINLEPPVSFEPSEKRKAIFLDCTHELISPCLVLGNNGHGKSLAAYVLSRAIPFEGTATVTCRGKTGRARLLFQDVVNQTLLRSFNRLARPERHKGDGVTSEIYDKLINEFVSHFERRNLSIPWIGYNDTRVPKSLLEVKVMLLAVRLSTRPSVIILDEPEWGLSRDAAQGLVFATVKVAHELGVPLLLISHKSWWRNIANTTIEFTKEILPCNNLEIRMTII